MIFKKYFNKYADQVDFFAEKFSISPRIAEIILSRGIHTEEDFAEFLYPSVSHDPFLLDGMSALADRIKLAKALNDRVLVFGDYDVDGVSATAIMLKTLSILGIKADYYLPNRYIDGYGLTKDVIDKIAETFNPNLIITVDCGISCAQEVDYAATKGIEVIVTDHHEIPDVLPNTIVLNAKKEGQAYPFREICGTGMALKVSQALLGEKEAEQFLPIAALATIADIVPLLDENRAIVTKGLRLAHKHLPIGIKLLFKEYDLNLTRPSSTDISFKIAPKLNAPGRMGDASDSLKLYLEEDIPTLKKYIEKIKQHNVKRQELCSKIMADCEKVLSRSSMGASRVICLASKAWDQGVLGIVCSRLVEKYHKPVFLFAQEGDMLHGSGRSIDDINIHQLLSSLKDILVTFGGHSMAAGVTITRDNYKEFADRVNAFALQNVSDEVFIPIKYYDQDITEDEINTDFFAQLDMLEPFGCDNPRPKFKITASNVTITPMKHFPQHCNVSIGKMDFVYFNMTSSYTKLMFSRQKSFIVQFQEKPFKGIVDEFDGGSFISEDAYKKLNILEINQLGFDRNKEAKFSLYPKNMLLNFVGETNTTVFGTAFVALSCFDYVEFSKNYSATGLYHFGVYDSEEIGFNSLLLCPKGVDWARNFSKIVFLSPVVDNSYIAALKEVTDAEIFLPLDKKLDKRAIATIDLTRETFGKIYSIFSAKNNKYCYNIFDYYEKNGIENFANFNTFYAAICVFNELGLITILDDDKFAVYPNKGMKRSLDESQIYSSLCALKDTFRRNDD